MLLHTCWNAELSVDKMIMIVSVEKRIFEVKTSYVRKYTRTRSFGWTAALVLLVVCHHLKLQSIDTRRDGAETVAFVQHGFTRAQCK